MLKFGITKDCDCLAGYFDSRIDYGNLQKTPVRMVEMAELEFFQADYVTYISGKQFRFRPGMMLCVQPGVERYSDLPFCNYYLKIGQTEKMAPLFNFMKQLPMISYVSQLNLYIEHILSIREAIARNNSWKIMEHICAVFALLTEELPSLGQDPSTSSGRVVTDAIAYMNANLGAHITLADIAGAVFLSPVYFHSIFRRVTGETPLRYLTGKRLERAKVLLLSTRNSVSEIAEQCGFSSDTYFSAVFSRAEGKTPRQYRNQYRSSF